MAAIPSFLKDKTDTPTKPMERSKHRTIEPENESKPSPINLLRVVRDHADATIAEKEDNIRALKAELAKEERELSFLMQLKETADEFFK